MSSLCNWKRLTVYYWMRYLPNLKFIIQHCSVTGIDMRLFFYGRPQNAVVALCVIKCVAYGVMLFMMWPNIVEWPGSDLLSVARVLAQTCVSN